MDVQTLIAEHHNAEIFVEEFSFAKTKFKQSETEEVELADAVVAFGDVLIIFQIKERGPAENPTSDTERVWFKKRVLGKATRQIRDTLRFLTSGNPVLVENERGHEFDLASRNYQEIIKVVMYASGDKLPPDCRGVRFHNSQTAGFIHIVHALDYIGMSRTLAVPMEIVDYFRFRELLIKKFPNECSTLPEKAIAGAFIKDKTDTAPTIEDVAVTDRIEDPSDKWNLTPLLRAFHSRITGSDDTFTYYEILTEIAKLSRAGWRAMKERIDLCVENVREDRFELPYRFTSKDTDCGFVFVSTESEMTDQPNWSSMRLNGLQNFTLGHKYEQRLSKCVGLQVSKDGEHINIDWCFVSFPWEEDKEMQERLTKSNPFRPVSERTGFSFYTRDV